MQVHICILDNLTYNVFIGFFQNFIFHPKIFPPNLIPTLLSQFVFFSVF